MDNPLAFAPAGGDPTFHELAAGIFDAEAIDATTIAYPHEVDRFSLDGVDVIIRRNGSGEAVATDGTYTVSLSSSAADDVEHVDEVRVLAGHAIHATHLARLRSRVGIFPDLDDALLDEINRLTGALPVPPAEWEPGEPLHSFDDALRLASATDGGDGDVPAETLLAGELQHLPDELTIRRLHSGKLRVRAVKPRPGCWKAGTTLTVAGTVDGRQVSVEWAVTEFCSTTLPPWPGAAASPTRRGCYAHQQSHGSAPTSAHAPRRPGHHEAA